MVHPYKQPSSDSSSSSSSSSSSTTSNELPTLSYPELPISLDDDNQQAPVAEESSSSKAVNQQRRSSRDSQWSTSSDSTSDYSFEEDEPVNEEEEETFYKEVVKGQIFLGMTAMCHQPKPVGFVISLFWSTYILMIGYVRMLSIVSKILDWPVFVLSISHPQQNGNPKVHCVCLITRSSSFVLMLSFHSFC